MSSDEDLWAAVKHGQCELAIRVLESGASVDALDARGLTPLAEAVLNTDVPLVDALLASGADATYVLPNGEPELLILPQTPLLELVCYGAQALNEHDDSYVARRERELSELLRCFRSRGHELPGALDPRQALLGEWRLIGVLCPDGSAEELPLLYGESLEGLELRDARLRFEPDGTCIDLTDQLQALAGSGWTFVDGELRGECEPALYHGGRVLSATSDGCTYFFRKATSGPPVASARTATAPQAKAPRPVHPTAEAALAPLVNRMLDESAPAAEREAAIREFDTFGQHVNWSPLAAPEVLEAFLELAAAAEPFHHVETVLARAAESSTRAFRTLLARSWRPGDDFSRSSEVSRRFASALASAATKGALDTALLADLFDWIRAVLESEPSERDIDLRWDVLLNHASLTTLRLAERKDLDDVARTELARLAPSLVRWVSETDGRRRIEAKYQLQALALLGPLPPAVRDVVLEAAMGTPPRPARGMHRERLSNHEQGLAVSAALSAVPAEDLPVRPLADRVVALATTDYGAGVGLSAVEPQLHRLPSPAELQRALEAVASRRDHVSRAVDVTIRAGLSSDFLLPAVERLWSHKASREDALWCWRDLARSGSERAKARLLEACSSRSKALREQAKELYAELS